MDLHQRTEALEEYLNVFLDIREDALWLLHHVHQKVKDHFPNE